MGVTAVDIPLVKIGKAAELLGVSVQTLRKWEDSGELLPDRRSEGGVRYYDVGNSGSALRICRLSVMPVSPAMTKK